MRRRSRRNEIVEAYDIDLQEETYDKSTSGENTYQHLKVKGVYRIAVNNSLPS